MSTLRRVLLVIVALVGSLVVAEPAQAAPLPPAAGQYVPTTPARIVAAQSVGAHATYTVSPLGKGGIPTTGVSAVQFNLSARSTGTGSLTVFPAGVTKPGTSNVNFTPNVTVTGAVAAKLGPAGSVAIANNSAVGATIYVDVVGYFLAAGVSTGGSGYVSMTPARLVDAKAVGAGGSVAVAPQSQVDIPALNVTAVVAHLTVRSSTAGFATVYPDGVTRPVTADLNYDTAFYSTSLVTAKLGGNGQFRVFTSTAATIFVDVIGYYHRETGATFVGTTPARIVSAVSVAAGHTYSLAPLGKGGVPATGVSAVAFTLTALGTANGGLVVFPEDADRPAVASGHVRSSGYWPILQMARLGTGGRISISNSSTAPVRIYVDVTGWFATGTVPGVAAGVYATPINRAAVVSWRAPIGDGSAPATGYRVTISPGGSVQTVTGTSATFRNLTNGSSYTFTVQSIGAAGSGPVTPPSAPATPAVPTTPFPQHTYAVGMAMQYGSIAGGVTYDGVFAGSPLSRLAYDPTKQIRATAYFYSVPRDVGPDGELTGPPGIMRYQWSWNGCGRITVGPEEVVQVPVPKGINITNFVHVPSIAITRLFDVPQGCSNELDITYSNSPEQFDTNLYSVGSALGGPAMTPLTATDQLPSAVLDTGSDVVLYRVGDQGEMAEIQASGRLPDVGNLFRYYTTSCQSAQILRGYLLELGSPGMGPFGISKYVIPKEAAKSAVEKSAAAIATAAGKPPIKVLAVEKGAGSVFEAPEAVDIVAGANTCTKLG